MVAKSNGLPVVLEWPAGIGNENTGRDKVSQDSTTSRSD